MSENKYLQHKFMIGLIYPSFLGSVIYNILDKFNYDYMLNNISRYIVFILILMVYVMDYLHTDTNQVRQDYNKKQLTLDLIIVGILYWSIVVILDYGSYPNPEVIIAFTLFLSKLINLLWEFSRHTKDKLGQLLYAIYSVFYLGVIIVSTYSPYGMYSILIVLLSDVLISTYYDKIWNFYESKGQSKDRIMEKILSIEYPFYNDKILATESELQEINCMAKNSYIKKKDDQQVFSLEKLKKIYRTSPDSWIVLRKEQYVLGYAHAEIIQELDFNRLCFGLIDENDIEISYGLNDNLSSTQCIIHIGSLVIDKNPMIYKHSSVISLIIRLLDRLVKIIVEKQIMKIFSVEYEDANGVSHFKDKMCRYGFELVGRTKTNNNVFCIDLAKNKDSYFYSLLCTVASRQKKYYVEDENYIERLKQVFPNT